MDHPYLMHGDPHMPISKYSRGDGRVLLNPRGGVAWEEAGGEDPKDDLDEGDDDDVDGLEREYGSNAADAIRSHLSAFRSRMMASSPSSSTSSSSSSSSSTAPSSGSGGGAGGTRYYSPLDDVEERFRSLDRLTAATGSTQDLALRRRARTEGREYYRSGDVVPLRGNAGSAKGGSVDDVVGSTFDDDDDDDDVVGDGKVAGAIGRDAMEFGHGRGYDATSVFGKGASVTYPYGKDLPSPTYHPDFPLGSNVGNNPNDVDEEPWMHELNKLIYEEQYTEMELGEIDETYTPVNVQKEDMDRYMKEKERTKKYNMLEREDEHEKDREEKPDEILEMIKNGDDPNQEAFGPWYVCGLFVGLLPLLCLLFLSPIMSTLLCEYL
jgi:hypothetical protein